MSIKSYYRWALALPLLLPALATPLLMADDRLPGVLGAVVMYLFYSMLIGGIPYLLFATGFLLWMRRAPDDRVRTAVLLSPLLYTLVLLAWLAAFLPFDGPIGDSLAALGVFAAFGVSFGYWYVALAELARLLLCPRTARMVPAPAV
jgi:surface polysaccharide O-acyltransferase-like enzyme